MISELLKDYFPIILFFIIALVLSMGFIVLNFLFSPKNPIQKNFLLTNVVLNLLMTLEWSLMLDFTWLQFYSLFLI